MVIMFLFFSKIRVIYESNVRSITVVRVHIMNPPRYLTALSFCWMSWPVCSEHCSHLTYNETSCINAHYTSCLVWPGLVCGKCPGSLRLQECCLVCIMSFSEIDIKEVDLTLKRCCCKCIRAISASIREPHWKPWCFLRLCFITFIPLL